MILNELIFAILVAEGFLCLLIVLPFGKVYIQKVVQIVSGILGGSKAPMSMMEMTMAGYIILAVIAALFAGTLPLNSLRVSY